MQRFVLVILMAFAFAPRLAPAATVGPVNFAGELDLVGLSRSGEENVNVLNYGENPFHTARVRLFADAPIQDHVHVYTEFTYDDGVTLARLFGGFVRFSDPGGRDLHLEVGKIPLHIGAFPNRSYALKNALIGAPLLYQYHTDLRDDQIPTRPEDLIANRAKGYFTSYFGPGLTGVGYTGGRTMTLLYENCWDFGAAFLGTRAPFEFSAGVTNGVVGDPVMGDSNDGKQVLGRLGFVPAPWLRAGVWGARGPYLTGRIESDDLPAGGHTVDEYMQKVVGGDLELSYWRAVVYSEYAYSRYMSPYVGNLDSHAWYVEGKVTVIPGWYVAGRFDRMTFSDVPLATGGVATWDADVWKREIGIGFKPSTRLIAKLVHQQSQLALSPRVVHAFLAAQLAVTF